MESTRLPLAVITGLWLATAGHAQGQAQGAAAARSATAASATAGGAGLQSGATMDAVLKSKLDSGHAKVGDAVTAQTTADVKDHGTTVLPKGSKLTGHVTEVTAAGKGSKAASVGLIFDEAVTPKGQHIPMHAAISSVTTAAAASDADFNAADGFGVPMPAGGGAAVRGGGMLGGVAGAVGGAASTPVLAGTGAAAGGAAVAPLGGVAATGGAGGVFRASNGVPIRILPAAAGGAAGGGTLLTSQRGNLQLESGTHMQLQAMGAGSSAAAGGSAGADLHAGHQ